MSGTESTSAVTVPGYGVLDTARQETLRRCARLAATAMRVPFAIVVLAGLDRCWTNLADAAALADLPRDGAFRDHVLSVPEPTAVPDISNDLRFAHSPLVRDGPGLRFCASAPLTTPGSGHIGTLCVLDRQPRRMMPARLAPLGDVASLIVDQLELHREAAERKAAETAAVSARKQLAAVLESVPFDLWLCDASGRYALQSAVGRRSWGDHRGLLPEETAAPTDVRACWNALNTRVLAGETIRVEASYTHDGMTSEVEEFLAPVHDADGAIWGMVGVSIDIGERRRAEARLEASEARLRTAIESLPFDFWICDADGRYIMNNGTCRAHWGSHLGQRPEESDVTAAVTALWAETNRRVLGGETLRYETSYGFGDERRDVEAILAPVHSDGRIIGLVGVNIDITERKQAEARIAHLANHDPLTGLPNRRMFHDRLGDALSRSGRNGELMALLLLDLDAFKGVNDTLGHDAGDAALCEVAARLRAGRRRHDMVARLGGDEFAVLLEGLRCRADAAAIATKIGAVLQRPCRHGEHEIHLNGSIGIAVYPGDAANAGDLLKHADIALYRAKIANRGGWEAFDDAMRVDLYRRRQVEAELRQGLCRSELAVFYQPIVDLVRAASVSFEALVRWRHPERGLLLPGEFLRVAEETGLVSPLGDFVLHRVAMDARRWIDAGLRLGRIAVNVAGPQFSGGKLDQTVASILAEAGLPAECLEIEVTEGVFLGGNVGEVADALDRLHRRGVAIVLDDFGTGYASLSHLRRFPIDKLKIDRSFVSGVLEDPNDAAIVRAIIDLGHSLGLQIVAEGVETWGQLEFLERHLCDQVQGFLIATPAPATEALEHAHAWSRPAPAPVTRLG